MAPQPEAAPPPPPPRPSSSSSGKKAGHGGHHGGAWKVAYADFVTAMMALFIVLWLMSADEKVKEEISAFFNNPTGPGTQTGTAAAGAGNAIQLPKEDMAKLREKMEQALKTMPNFREHERPRRDDHHRRWPAHRTARDRGRNVLRIGASAAHRHRARRC